MTPARSLGERLAREPDAFGFDAAVRVLSHMHRGASLADAVRFVSRPTLEFAGGDILGVELSDASTKVTLGLLGLDGAGGVLPRAYTELAQGENGEALHDLLDLLAHRMLAALGEAGTKYRLDRAIEAARLKGGSRALHTEALLAVTGFADPAVPGRLAFGIDALLHYAGLFVLRPRSAERLAALASDWLDMPVAVVEFCGAWLPVEPAQRTRLGVGRDPGRFATLGLDAAAGTRAWDPQACVVLRVGPMDRARFEALMPGTAALAAFVGLVRAFLGFDVDFAINLVLAGADVPESKLDAQDRPGPRLGWNSWLGRGAALGVRPDADDAMFAGEVVEAWRGGFGQVEPTTTQGERG